MCPAGPRARPCRDAVKLTRGDHLSQSPCKLVTLDNARPEKCRVAVFFTPPPEHPLTRAAGLWLGRDAESGKEHPQPTVAGLTPPEVEALTRAPRRYGFHATLKPPFRLVQGHQLDDVKAMLETVSARLRPVDLGKLRIEEIGHFFALTPSLRCDPVSTLAAEIVRRFDVFRAQPTRDEIARRQPQRLSARQRDNLDGWGYPYVFADFRFHMTLTGPVEASRRAAVRKALENHFLPLLDAPVVVDALALFVEPSPPGDFFVRSRAALSGN